MRNHVERVLSLPLIKARFKLAGIVWGKNWQMFGMPILQCHRGSQVSIGDNAAWRSSPRSNPLTPYGPVVISTRNATAVLRIGDDSGLTGAVVVAEERIEIGNRVLIGANAVVMDTDFHPLNPRLRRQQPCAGKHSPVIIEDDVFIGTRAMVLKGVHLGAGSVVGAGAVVTEDVPAGAVVAGNPARIVKQALGETPP